MKGRSSEIDAYIARSPEFARPILEQVRAAFHQGCPDLVECLKWGMPAFEYKGLLGGMAAFKAHAGWSLWRQDELADPHGLFELKRTMTVGKLNDVSQLPPRKVLVQYVKAAVKLNEAGPRKRKPTPPKPPLKVPSYFTQALKTNPRALATFQEFSPSCKREYVEWITEAKQEATRERRIATALEWLSQGKSRNWKYEKC